MNLDLSFKSYMLEDEDNKDVVIKGEYVDDMGYNVTMYNTSGGSFKKYKHSSRNHTYIEKLNPKSEILLTKNNTDNVKYFFVDENQTRKAISITKTNPVIVTCHTIIMPPVGEKGNPNFILDFSLQLLRDEIKDETHTFLASNQKHTLSIKITSEENNKSYIQLIPVIYDNTLLEAPIKGDMSNEEIKVFQDKIDTLKTQIEKKNIKYETVPNEVNQIYTFVFNIIFNAEKPYSYQEDLLNAQKKCDEYLLMYPENKLLLEANKRIGVKLAWFDEYITEEENKKKKSKK